MALVERAKSVHVTTQLTALRKLCSHRITRVVYYGLPCHTEIDWDYGYWHHPAAGVEFSLEDSSSLSILWGAERAHFQLAIHAGPMRDQWLRLGQADGPSFWDVSEHPRWASVLSQPALGAELLIDSEQRFASNRDEAAKIDVPLAFHLSFENGSVWIAAAAPMEYPPTDEFWLGADEVLVAFTLEMAEKLGIHNLTRYLADDR